MSTGRFANKVSIPPHVIARRVGDETVILDMENGAYYGLDAVGARFWDLTTQAEDVNRIADVLLGEFDVDREMLERDIEALIENLSSRRLINLT